MSAISRRTRQKLPGHTRDMASTNASGFVDLVARVVRGSQAGGVADRAVDIGEGTARPTDDVVVVVGDPSLKARR